MKLKEPIATLKPSEQKMENKPSDKAKLTIQPFPQHSLREKTLSKSK